MKLSMILFVLCLVWIAVESKYLLVELEEGQNDGVKLEQMVENLGKI